MQLIFADENTQFLKTLEQLFRASHVSAADVVPVTVSKSANYVYNALPPWTRACVVDGHEVHSEGKGEVKIDTTRTLLPVRFRDRVVTRARIRPPAWTSPAQSPTHNTTCESPDMCEDINVTTKTNAYYATRAALVAAARISKDHGLDVVVLPCMGSSKSFHTAHDMYTATRDFFKFQ